MLVYILYGVKVLMEEYGAGIRRRTLRVLGVFSFAFKRFLLFCPSLRGRKLYHDGVTAYIYRRLIISSSVQIHLC